MIAITVALIAAFSGQLFEFPELISTPIQGNVLVDQQPSNPDNPENNNYDITIITNDMGNTDYMIVQSPSGIEYRLEETGDRIRFTNIQQNELILVIGHKDGNTEVVQQITAGE